jgi:hypothetical protein
LFLFRFCNFGSNFNALVFYCCLAIALRAFTPTLSMQPCINVSHIQVLVSNLFPTPPIKLKLGLQAGGRLLTATHLDQSNYLANQKQGPVNKYELTVFIRLFPGSGSCKFFQPPRSPPVDSLDWTDEPHPRFPGQGHILSVGGDALSVQSPAVEQISGGNCGFNFLCFRS